MNEPLLYRLLWKAGSVYPGAHPGQLVGVGPLYKRHAPLLASPDPRRIDMRASLLDPFSSYRVRVYQQQSNVDVYMLADLSASMAYHGSSDKKHTVRQLLTALAESAYGYGDKFGFIGCGDTIDHQFLVPASRHGHSLQQLSDRLSKAKYQGSAKSLVQAVKHLPGKRALVFLVSDLHFPLTQLQKLLASLQGHEVLPVVLWDENETVNLPEWGLVTMQDMENNKKIQLFMRPALKQKMIAAYQHRQQQLQACCRSFGIEPLFMNGAYNAQQINRYFQQRAA
ncbi:MAG: MxaS protein [Methylococcales bacterium]